ncbi:hypothetical protein [Chryseosolibacter indicus]|uniref:Lipoprotein n=1 Tax=Chryseosolibacter indicus TaxID=2782351 RepID=A0ABS5W1R4_9BACT|nr:hypothetical protein [Chryseosolibacter indicus]MBT1706186.1 hypothetical protein [Chryseosolibacter indicus]
MRFILVIVLFALVVACDGKLSDEQRRRMHEQMELHKIKKVSEVEITETAYAEGRKIIALLENTKGDSSKIDSLVSVSRGSVRWVEPGKGNVLALEQQLVDAYLADETGSLQDNVQKVRNAGGESDSLLYTKPVVVKMPDGTEKLEGVWNIWLSKKQLILSMDK